MGPYLPALAVKLSELGYSRGQAQRDHKAERRSVLLGDQLIAKWFFELISNLITRILPVQDLACGAINAIHLGNTNTCGKYSRVERKLFLWAQVSEV
jgi:hypothetical protein